MSDKPKLTYFDGRGYAELVRMTLCACNIEFQDTFMTTHDDFLQLKKDGKLLFGQVPLLEVDGLRLVQRRAILHYLAKREGLEGKTDAEKAMVDMYFEGTRDFMNGYDFLVFSPVEPILAEYKAKHFPRYLPVFEKGLDENKTGFLVGDSMTLADLALLEPLLTSIEYFGEDIFNDYPNIKKFHKMMTEKPAIAKFLSGPIRKPRNTQEHIDDVQRILGMVITL